MAGVVVVALPFKLAVPRPKPVDVEAIVRKATMEGYYSGMSNCRCFTVLMRRYGMDIKTIRSLTMRQLSYLNGNPQSQKASR